MPPASRVPAPSDDSYDDDSGRTADRCDVTTSVSKRAGARRVLHQPLGTGPGSKHHRVSRDCRRTYRCSEHHRLQTGEHQPSVGSSLLTRCERVGTTSQRHQMHRSGRSGRLEYGPEGGGHQSFELEATMHPRPIVEDDGHRGGAFAVELADEPRPVADLGRPVQKAEPVTGHVGTESLEFAQPLAEPESKVDVDPTTEAAVPTAG